MAKKKANVEGTLDGGNQQDGEAKTKTRAANKVVIELSPRVVSILRQGSSELAVKMPDLLRRLGESPEIERAADALLEGIAKAALEKLQKWVPSSTPSTKPDPGPSFGEMISYHREGDAAVLIEE